MRRAIVHPLPVGLVVDGEVVDPVGLAAELRTLFAEHKLPRDVRVGLAHPRLMVRMVELPATLSGRDLDGAVHHLAGDLLPIALDQLVVDHCGVGNAPFDPSTKGGAQQRILMAAARVDGIERLTQSLELAGLRAQRIQLSGLALLSALDHPPLPDQAILYVQAGSLTNVVITEDGEPLLVRAASAGSEAIASGLAERAGITHETARAHVAAMGVGAAPHHGTPAVIADELGAMVSQQVREGLRRIVAEIQSSRGVYAARPDARPVGAVVVTGAMTDWPGVVEALSDELHLPVLPAGRDGWPDLGTIPVSPARLDVAVGLTRAGDDERPDLRLARSGTRRSADIVPARGVAQVACAMLALVAAAVVYLVVVANQVSSGREDLAEIQTQLVQTEGQAAALKPYHDFATAAVARREAIANVAESRFNWDRTLTELAQVAPGGVWLTSARGTLAPTTQIEGGQGAAATSGLRGALPAPALELAGCAGRERDVPAYMDRLHAITGVTEVAFSRSERLEKRSAGTTSKNTSNDCRNGDPGVARFALVTYFKTTPAQAAAAAAVAAPAAAPSPAAAKVAAANSATPQEPATEPATARPNRTQVSRRARTRRR